MLPARISISNTGYRVRRSIRERYYPIFKERFYIHEKIIMDVYQLAKSDKNHEPVSSL